MPSAPILSAAAAVGLIRPSRRNAFCPACRILQTGDTRQEIAAPAIVCLTFLILAAVAWAVTIVHSSSMDDMQMGPGSIGTFAAGWTVMLAAMMLPSAIPLVFEFARNVEGRRGWLAATCVLGGTYLGVWLAFGVVCYALYSTIAVPWSNQRLIGGVALVIAGVYAFTPLKRACEAWCRELAALHSPLPFSLMRSAMLVGFRYALSCLGCNGALMLAMVLIGLSNLLWTIVLTAVMLTYKLAPPQTLRWSQFALSSALVAVGVLYVVGG